MSSQPSPSTILVVDDDEHFSDLVATALRLAGYQVRQAADGLAALQRIDEDLPDLVVLDLGLPRISGFGVLHDLASQTHTRGIPVLVVTASDGDLSHLSVDAIFRKPFSVDELVRAVRRALAAR